MENINVLESEKIKIIEAKINKLRKDLAHHNNMVEKIKTKLNESEIKNTNNLKKNLVYHKNIIRKTRIELEKVKIDLKKSKMKSTNVLESEKIKLIEIKINKLRKDLAYHKNMVSKTRTELEETKIDLKKFKAGFIIS